MLTSKGFTRLIGVAAALLLTLLSGCYLPDQFFAEIRLNKTGGYSMTYKGDLVYLPLLGDIGNKKLSEDEIKTKTAQIEEDLRRESYFKKIELKSPARWAVEYERQGQLEASQLATFVRRNARILTIKSTPQNEIVIDGTSIGAENGQRMLGMGVTLKGELRVVTDGTRVRTHNASEVRAFGPYTVYIWKIDNPLSPSPHFAMARDTTP